MTIEQPPALNRFIDPSIPLTWAYRWRQCKLVLPVLVFVFVLWLEMGVLNAWLADKLNWDWIATLLASYLFLLLFLLGMAEVQVRITRQSRRVLHIKEKKLLVQPASPMFIAWKAIRKFQFAPLADAPGLAKLTIFKAIGFGSRVGTWSIILKQPTEVQELISLLKAKLTGGICKFEIATLAAPVAERPSVTLSRAGLSVYLAGYYFLFHGLPLLLITILGGHGDQDNRASHLTAEKKAWLGHLLARHFSSLAQFHHFVFWLGFGLTCLGIIFLVWGSSLMRPKPHNTPKLTIQS